MAGKAMRLLCVGRQKTAFWRAAAEHYLQRLKPMRPVEVCEIRDGAGSARGRDEGARLLEGLSPGDYAIALDERGVLLSSRQFANLLADIDSRALGRPCFVLGGPFGLDGAVVKGCKMSLSLSPMTWPHELARTLLLEQLYRAECIRRNIPYHH